MKSIIRSSAVHAFLFFVLSADAAVPTLSSPANDACLATLKGSTTVTLHVGQRIEGLFYRVISTTELGGEWTAVTEFLPVGDFTVDRKATDESAFYKIEVSDIGESVP